MEVEMFVEGTSEGKGSERDDVTAVINKLQPRWTHLQPLQELRRWQGPPQHREVGKVNGNPRRRKLCLSGGTRRRSAAAVRGPRR